MKSKEIHYLSKVIHNIFSILLLFLKLIDISEEIKIALQERKPIVALESTIITHGMDYPINHETAISVEKIIRDNGAIPATIAIIDGRIKIGLKQEEIKMLSQLDRSQVQKCSRRDLAAVLIKKQNGSTTVAATVLIAHLIGIQIFVTGGIGGVHRGAEFSFDISADLIELGRTPVAVVSAGCKSILDIEKTLEYLETQGVNVVSYQSDYFPEFYTNPERYKSNCRFDTFQQLAELINVQFNELKLQTGILIGVPIPKEFEADGKQIQAAIDQSLQESKVNNIIGAQITPFLLKRVNEISKGNSQNSSNAFIFQNYLFKDIALIKNNAKIGAQIAVSLNKIQNK